MVARVTRFVGLPPERIEATLRQFQEEHLPSIRETRGFHGVEVLVDRQGGRAIAIAYWEGIDDLRASEKVAGQAREAAVSRLDPERPPLVETYEVVLAERGPSPVASTPATA